MTKVFQLNTMNYAIMILPPSYKKNVKNIPFYTTHNVINNHISPFTARIILYHLFHKYFFLLAFALKIKIRDV